MVGRTPSMTRLTACSPGRGWTATHGFLLLACALTFGCAGAEGEVESATSLGLPAWTGEERRLFADELDPAALGLSPSSVSRKDPNLWLRAQRAELVSIVSVKTFTLESTRGGTYRIGLKVEQPLAEPTFTDPVIEVSVDPGDPAYGLFKAQDTLLQNKRFVGFFKRYAAADDQIVTHFYLAAESPDMLAVVLEAVALKDINRAAGVSPSPSTNANPTP